MSKFLPLTVMTTVDSRAMPSHVDISYPFGSAAIPHHPVSAMHPAASHHHPSLSSLPSQFFPRSDRGGESHHEGKSSASSPGCQPFYPPFSSAHASLFHHSLLRLPLLSPPRTEAEDRAMRESLAERIERERRQDEEREAQQQRQLHQNRHQEAQAPAESRHTSFMVKDILSDRVTPIHKPIPKHPASCTTCNCLKQRDQANPPPGNNLGALSPATSPHHIGNSQTDCYIKFGVNSILTHEDCALPHHGKLTFLKCSR